MSYRSIVLIAALSLLLAGCGGPSSMGDTSSGSSVAATTGSTTTGAGEWVARPPLHSQSGALPRSTAYQGGYKPSQLRHAYGFDALTNDGSGQTIAIVDAYDAPNIVNDVKVFSTQWGLPQFNVTGGPTFTKVNQTGGTRLPKADGGWAQEISLDVEWAHAIAPRANILLVEASTAGLGNLLAAVDYAARNAGVVSMSWGGSEFSSEASYDYHFNVTGVSFFASSGDSGGALEYPSVSPFVISVGGTKLPLDASGNLTASETAWSSGGGGTSAYETQPAYQNGFQTSGRRQVPDVSYDADPSTGVAVYDSYTYSGMSGWLIFGGTSAGAPQWAALAALANQSRATLGKPRLSSNSATNNPVYNAAGVTVYASDYRDITGGSNSHPATTGYDQATGLGSPLANSLVPFLGNN